ncbi:MAG TPA: hypothetical protein VGK31_13700 [Thermoanaerobaculia bacterium]|jgi:hypothetical protein
MLVDLRTVTILPTLDEIFNVVSGDADRAHAERVDRAQLPGSDQLPH